MEYKKCSMSIIIPAYNEEPNLENSVLQTMKTCMLIDLDFEIIIIDDSSMDRTREIMLSLAHSYPNVRVFHHENNQGSGGAFRTGIAHAKKEYVMFVPVDNPLDPEDLESYLPRIDVCDIVVGLRIERVGYSRFARFASFTYNRILVPLLFNIGVSDVNWIQIYRRSLFADGIIAINSKSLFWLVEILIRAKKRHLIIAEVPARMKKRTHGRATISRFPVILQTFTEMIKFFIMLQKDDINQ